MSIALHTMPGSLAIRLNVRFGWSLPDSECLARVGSVRVVHGRGREGPESLRVIRCLPVTCSAALSEGRRLISLEGGNRGPA
jgi:hypothetical protein